MSKRKNLLEVQSAGTGKRVTAPAPVGGWNTRDSLALMDPADAPIMTNWFPGQGSVYTRKGHTEFCTGLTGFVETLMSYNANSIQKLIAANGDELNDITSGTPSNIGSGFLNARWQNVNFNSYLIMVNGEDTPQTYDGTTLAASTINGSGMTASQLDGINVYKNRVYVWDSDTQDVWYGATNAIGGTFTKFQLSRVAPQGGNLVSMVTWNLDGSSSVSTYAMFLMSSGDVLLYQGSDPGSDFVLVGTYKIGAPVAIRGALKIAGDVVIITNRDFVFFSEVFKNDGAITSQGKLSGAAIEAVQNYGGNYGWEIHNYSKAPYLLFNIPVLPNTEYEQYVINTITGAGCRFTGMNSNTWGIFDGDLYFGANGVVYKADDGFDDNGVEIETDCQAAYNLFENGQEKRLNAFRNVLKCDGSLNISAVVNFDYGDSRVSEQTVIESSGTYWDVSDWDVSYWSPENQLNNKLILSGGQGTALGMRISVDIMGQQLFWYRTDYSLTLSNII
jgi:hypothetical protein